MTWETGQGGKPALITQDTHTRGHGPLTGDRNSETGFNRSADPSQARTGVNDTMRSEQLTATERVRVPSPRADEVLVRVGAAGINNTDIWSREGAYAGNGQEPVGWLGTPLRFPRIQGGDIAGRIAQIGPGVPCQRIGERVLVNALLYGGGDAAIWDAQLLGSERDGGFAEFVTVPADNAHAIEANLSNAELATLPIAYLTALHMLNRVHLGAGETLLVTGASGGVGSALIQLALTRGARAVALTSSGKQRFIDDLGAREPTGTGARALAELTPEGLESVALRGR